MIVEIRIGILNAPRELSFESTQPAGAIAEKIGKALEAKEPLVALEDEKGSSYLVPTASIAYVQIGAEETRRVGFVA